MSLPSILPIATSTALVVACIACGDSSTRRQSPTVITPTVGPMSSAVLQPETQIQRIVFGSCYVPQFEDSAIWDTISATEPDVVLFLGDNVYQSEEKSEPELLELRQAYAALARDEPFARLRQRTPLLVTWDDHDYGLNDAGGDWPHKRLSEALFEDVWAVSADDPRRSRDGVYHSAMVGPEGRQVQLLVLDTRFFRSPLNRDSQGYVVPDADAAKTLLGASQWAWLEGELRRPAAVRIVASSIQVLTDAYTGERWGAFPFERQRLFKVIAATGAAGVIFVSGDRHLGAIYRDDSAGPYPMIEITSSSLNFPITGEAVSTWDEPEPHRLGDLYFGVNFGMVTVDWDAAELRLELRDQDSAPVRSLTVSLDELQPPRTGSQ